MSRNPHINDEETLPMNYEAFEETREETEERLCATLRVVRLALEDAAVRLDQSLALLGAAGIALPNSRALYEMAAKCNQIARDNAYRAIAHAKV